MLFCQPACITWLYYLYHMAVLCKRLFKGGQKAAFTTALNAIKIAARAPISYIIQLQHG